MKIRHAIAITLSALLLSGCVSNEFQSATSGTQETNHTPTQSITTTTTGQSDVLTDPTGNHHGIGTDYYGRCADYYRDRADNHRACADNHRACADND